MDADRWPLVKDRFNDALALAGADRRRLLDGLDVGTRTEVEALLALAEDTSGVLDAPLDTDLLPTGVDRAATGGPASAPAHPALGPGPLTGVTLGPYSVGPRIGRGGMGDVYRAHRADGLFERAVALKVVRDGADSVAVLARFAAERRILGSLEHPNIARLIAAGAETVGPAAGRPWLALELVDGVPITEVAQALPVEERVALVADVARALDHAHRRLVVHRDLKPSNVLVTTREDGARGIKLLDFGIAKLLDPEADADLTALHLRTPMTRAYAAPEQIRGETITTATDVYGLGLLLFEVLTGRRPFATDGTVRQLEHDILETEVPAASAVTEAGGAEARRLRGDLDVICQAALAKEPDARYHTAEALAADLDRWLRGEPVTARAPSLGYRMRRFVSRHRVPVGIGALALVVALSVATVANLRVDRERAVAQRAVADADAAAFTQGELLRVLQPSFRAEQDLLQDAPVPADIEKAIDRAVETVETTQAGAPGVLAGNLLELGTTLYERGDLTRADSLFARSLALRRPLGREGDRVILMALIGRGHVAKEHGDRAAARRFYREALEMERDHPELTTGRAANPTELFLTAVLDDADENERILLQTLAERRATLAASPTAEAQIWVAQAHNALAGLFFNRGDYRAAFAEFRAAEVIVRRHLGELHPSANTLRGNLSYTAAAMGRYPEAVEHARIALDAARRGGLGVRVESTMRQALGQALLMQGDLDGAERELLAADALRASMGEAHASGRRQVQASLAAVYSAQGRPVEALEMAEAVEAIYRRDGGLGEPNGILAQARTTAYRFVVGPRDGTVERLVQFARDIRRSDAPPDIRAWVLQFAGEALRENGDAQAAEPLLRQALAATRESHPDNHVYVLRARFDYGRVLAALGRLAEARPHLEAARGHLPHVTFPSALADPDAEIARLLAGR